MIAGVLGLIVKGKSEMAHERINWERFQQFPAWVKFERQMEGNELTDGTRRQYRKIIAQYLLASNKNPGSIIGNIKKLQGDAQIETMKNLFSDFHSIYKGKGSRPVYDSAMREFLRGNNISFDWKLIPRPRKKEIRERNALSKEDIERLLGNCDLREKSIILLKATTGARVHSISNIKVSDIDFDLQKILMEPKTSLVTHKYRTFTTRETLETLKDYLALTNPNPEKPIFNIDKRHIWRLIHDKMREVGIIDGEKKGEYKFTLMSFRRFFRNICEKVKLAGFGEALLGHNSKLSEIYLRLPDQEAYELYKRELEPLLTFNPNFLSRTDEKKLEEQINKEKEGYLRAVLHGREFQEEVKDWIKTKLSPTTQVKEVFYDVLTGSNTIILDIKGYLDNNESFHEFQGKIIKKLSSSFLT